MTNSIGSMEEWIGVNRTLDELAEFREQRRCNIDSILKRPEEDEDRRQYEAWLQIDSRRTRLELSATNFIQTKKAARTSFYFGCTAWQEIFEESKPKLASTISSSTERLNHYLEKARLFTIPCEGAWAAYEASMKLAHESYKFMLEDKEEFLSWEGSFLRESVGTILEERIQAPFPTDLPFPVCFFSFAPYVRIYKVHNIAWEFEFNDFGDDLIITFA